MNNKNEYIPITDLLRKILKYLDNVDTYWLNE